MELEYRRPLPLELLAEIHKCLPLPDAIYVLVNISSWEFVNNNSPRMRRTIERIKTSLEEYIYTLVGEDEDEDEYGRESLDIYKNVEWKPELDALFRYGSWLTSRRRFCIGNPRFNIVGIPTNYTEELLLHLANSRLTQQMMLQHVRMIFARGTIPIPTFLKPLLNKMEQHQIGGRFIIGSVQLETVNGQILHIFDGKLHKYQNGHSLGLIVVNKMDRKNWFTILIGLDSSNKFIWRLEFSKKNLESFDDIEEFITEQGGTVNGPINQNGNKLKAKSLCWTGHLDLFLRRGAAFTKFRHFKIKELWEYFHPTDYADFLVNYISNTKHPEDFLESVEMNFKKDLSLSIHEIWEYCHKGIGEGFEKKKLHILSAKTTKLMKDFSNSSAEYSLEFTLANLSTNGAYVFDVEVKSENDFEQIAGIKIRKRKIDEIAELKCKDQIGLGKKRKATNDGGDGEDGPTCSAKMK